MRLKYSKELLEPIVKNSVSVAQVIRKLGLKQSGGNQTNISKRIKLYQIDISHFLGSRANHGPNHKGGPDRLTPSKVLVDDRLNGRREHASTLRRVLLESGIEHKCAVCGLPPFWNGKYLQLQIDHINGIGTDNRMENIRFICGNCHMQTDNFGVKNVDVGKKLPKPKKIKPMKIETLKPVETDPNWRNRPRPSKRKVARPSKEELAKLLWEKPTSAVASQFGVSDKAVEKWAKIYQITKPPRGYWAKLSATKL